MLVCGTLVYSKGDVKEEEEEEQLFGGDASDAPEGPPTLTPIFNALPAAVPGARGPGSSTQPITMHGSHSSFKVRDSSDVRLR